MPVEIINSRKNPVITNPLRHLGVSRSLAVGAAANSVLLTATCEAVSMTMVGCNARIKISISGTTAVATDHRILDGERIDLGLAVGSTVSAIAESGTGTLSISELV
jgi:hypothetical protein